MFCILRGTWNELPGPNGLTLMIPHQHTWTKFLWSFSWNKKVCTWIKERCNLAQFRRSYLFKSSFSFPQHMNIIKRLRSLHHLSSNTFLPVNMSIPLTQNHQEGLKESMFFYCRININLYVREITMTKAFTKRHMCKEWCVQTNTVLDEDMTRVTGWEMMARGLVENHLRQSSIKVLFVEVTFV